MNNEERYALAMQASDEGLWDWIVATDEFYVSPRMLELYGLPADTLFAGRADFLRRHPFSAEDEVRWNEALDAYLAGKSPRVDIEVRMPGAEERWIRLKALCQRDARDTPTRWTGLVSDVTARKQAERALQLSEERYGLAMQASGEGHWDWNILTDEYYCSPRNNELAGFPRDKKWSGRADIVDAIPFHADDWPRYRAAVAAHFAGDTPRMDIDMRILRPEGGVRWVRMIGMCRRDGDGKPVRWAGSAMDITEQKNAEEALHVSEERLRQAQRLEALGTLAGGIAHDFNNILGAVLGYGEMALHRVEPGGRLRHELECILTAGERGRSLVERILAFSRGGIAERTAVDVEKVVREALDHVSARLPSNVRLAAELAAARAALHGDPTQVHQIVTNLATNAMHAMVAGGVLRIALRTERLGAARSPTVGTLPSGDYIVLEVADTGTGIPAEILDRIFDPFFTTKEVGVGTGLGLSLVHGIVSNLGGGIDVASAAGKGTTFTVYFPRSGEAAESDAPDKAAALPAGEQQRVLVVDDEEALVTLVCRTLETLGYVPTGFTSSSAALQAFRADPFAFDALVTDERMPGLPGAALIREVRAIRSGIPILLVSGYIGGKVTLDALEAGADEVLKKPLLARELARSLSRIFAAPRNVGDVATS